MRRRLVAMAVALGVGVSLLVAGCAPQDESSVVALENTAVEPEASPKGVVVQPAVHGPDSGIEVPGLRIESLTYGTADEFDYFSASELVDNEQAPRDTTEVTTVVPAPGQVLVAAKVYAAVPLEMPTVKLQDAPIELSLWAGDTQLEFAGGELTIEAGLSDYEFVMSVPEADADRVELVATVGDRSERLRLSDGVRSQSDAVEHNAFGAEASVDSVPWEVDSFAGYVRTVAVYPAVPASFTGAGADLGWAPDGTTYVGLRIHSVVADDRSTLTLRLDDGTELEPADSPENPGSGTFWFEVPTDAGTADVLVHLASSDTTVDTPVEVPLRLETPDES